MSEESIVVTEKVLTNQEKLALDKELDYGIRGARTKSLDVDPKFRLNPFKVATHILATKRYKKSPENSLSRRARKRKRRKEFLQEERLKKLRGGNENEDGSVE